jgi:hypothetical protein
MDTQQYIQTHDTEPSTHNVQSQGAHHFPLLPEWIFLWRRKLETTEKLRPHPSYSHLNATISDVVNGGGYVSRQYDYTCEFAKNSVL